MPVSAVSFSAQVDSWVRETDARMTGVFRQSAQEVIEEMQKPVGAGGNMPIDTGFLRSSLQVGINAPAVPANRPKPGGPQSYNSNVASVAIVGAKIGDTIVASYSANYAPFVEYGTEGRAPRRFVGLAVLQWKAIVDRVAARLKSNVTGR